MAVFGLKAKATIQKNYQEANFLFYYQLNAGEAQLYSHPREAGTDPARGGLAWEVSEQQTDKITREAPHDSNRWIDLCIW